MLISTMEKTAAFIASDAHQTGNGALTHDFEIGGIQARRMVTPYHVYMLQRLAGVVDQSTTSEKGSDSVSTWLGQFHNGLQLLELNDRLESCRVRKEGARLFSVN